MGPKVGFLDRGGGVSGPRALLLRSPGKATSGTFSGGGGVEAWTGLGLGPGVGGSFGLGLGREK